MFHRLKAQATDDAQTRSTSRTSWRDKILLGALSLALGKMGWTACGQINNDTPNPNTTPCTPLTAIGATDPTATMDFASPDPLHVCYNAPLAIHTGCNSLSTVAGLVITRDWYGTSPCPGGAYSVSVRKPMTFSSSTEYTCDGGSWVSDE